MQELFRNSLGDIYLVYSLAFVLLGTVVAVLPRQDRTLGFAPDLWLISVFGFLHGAYEYSEWRKVVYAPSPMPPDLFNLVLLTLSFLALLEFGRRTLRLDPHRTLPPDSRPAPLAAHWLYGAVAIGMLGLLRWAADPLTGLLIGDRYLVGLPAACLTGLALLAHVRRADVPLSEARVAGPLRLVAVTFLVYGLLTSILPGGIPSLPALLPTHEGFLAAFGFPVQLLRAGCAVVLVVGFTQIMRRVNAQAMRRESAARADLALANVALTSEHRTLVELAPCGIHEIDPGGRVISMNPAGLRMLRANRPEEVIGHPYISAAVPDEQERITSLLREALGGATRTFEYTSADGRRFQSNFVPLTEGNGTVSRLMGVSVELTDIRRAEQALERERDFAQALADRAPVIILLLDPDGRIQFVNPWFEQVSGYRLDEVRGKDWFDTLLPERDRDRMRSLFRSARGGAPTRGTINPIATRSGEERSIEWHNQVIRDTQGAPTGVLAIGSDVTERQRTEQELREREAALASFKFTLDQTLDCVFIFRPGDLRFIYVNEGAKRQVGYSEAELHGMTPLDIKPEFTPERFRQLVRPLIDGTRPMQHFETVHRHKDGYDIPVEIVLQLVQEAGGEARFVAVVRDITDRRRAEAALRASEERLRDILDSMFVFVGLLSLEGVLIDINRAPLEAGDVRREDAVGRPLWDTYWWSHSAETQQRLRDTLHRAAQGEVVRQDFEVRMRGGQPTMVDAIFGPLRDRTGRIVQVVGSGTDVTERHRAFESQRLSEQRLQQAARVARIGIFEHDHATDTIYCSPELRDICGFTPEEEVSLSTYLDRLHPEDLPRIGEAIRRAHDPAGDGGFDVGYRVVRRDGEVRWLTARSQTTFSYGGTRRKLRTVGAVVDVTERKQIEEQLARRIRQLDILERINRVTLASSSTEELLQGVLDEVLVAFDADRAWFLSPCDPEAPSWSVPMERTRPEWPGAMARGAVVPMTPDVAELFRMVLASADPIQLGEAATHPLPAVVAEQFSVRTQVQMALRPLVGSPWSFGLHHCAQARAYDVDDLLIFKAIGVRVSDALGHLTALESLRENEERLRLALTAANQGLFDLNVQTGECIVTPEYALMLGYDPAEFRETNAAWRERLHPEDREEVYQIYEDYVAGRRDDYRIEFRQRTRTGDWKWILSLGKLVARSADGQPLRMLGTHTDITESRRAEEALRLSQQRLQQAVRVARIGIFDHDHLTDVIYWSPEQREIYGFSPDEAVTLPKYLERVFPEDIAYIGEAVGRAHDPAGDGAFDVSHRIVRRDGEVRWLTTRSQTMFVGEGAARHKVRTVGAVADVTDRVRADDTLRARESALREAQRIAHLGSWELDLTQGVLTWSDEVFRIFEIAKTRFGASYEALVNLIHPEDRGEVDRAHLRSLEDHMPYELVHRILMPDGRVKYLQERAEIVCDETGRPVRSRGTVHDITERVQAEQALQQLNLELEDRVRERTARLEAARKELEAFAYSVSHDLKAPLRGIDGYSRLLAEDYAGQLGAEGQGFLDNICQAAARMNQLIDDLLAYSRLEQRAAAAEPLDPRALVESLLAERADEIRSRGVAVRVRVPFDSVQADREGLAMALRNLIDNALKFSRETPKPMIEVGGRHSGGSHLLWVRDNGIGFDMKFANRVFDMFQRLHLAEDYPGTGIGLAIVRKAMERMGGRAWAESEPGRGTTFYLEVPE